MQNIDKCDRSGPDVPILLRASTDASIALHPDGSNETVGDISVQPLPCSDNHTQVYRVSIPSTEDYILCGEILFALLPKRCIAVNASSKLSAYPRLSTSFATPILVIGIVAIIVVSVSCYPNYECKYVHTAAHMHIKKYIHTCTELCLNLNVA